MAIIKYEFIKLWKKKMFLALFAAFLALNLLTLYTCEQYTAPFFYVYQQQESYQRFLQGDTQADIDGYYQQDLDDQALYIASYDTFVGEMQERVEQMGQVSLFADKDGYVYRNLVKSCQDFAAFSSIPLEADNCFGVRELANYSTGILFLLLFLSVLAYYILFWERDANLLLLLKGNRKGHLPLAAGKLAVMLSTAVLYTLLQELSTILFLGRLYGYGSLGRTIQSVSLFRNCAYPLTVGGALVSILLIRVAIAVVLACGLFCIGMLLKNVLSAVACAGAIFGVEYLFSRVLSSSGALAGLKCVNPFSCWNMAQVLGAYQNLNLLGYPVGKNLCALVTAVVLAAALPVVSLFAFHKTCQIKTESRLERLLQWLRGKLSVFQRRSSLLYHEFFKMMIQQKKGIIFVFLLAWGIYAAVGALGLSYYANAEEAAYHHYAGLLSGPVSEETFSFLEEEQARLEEVRRQMLSYGGEPAGENYINQLSLKAELERLEEGFYRFRAQIDALQEKPGNVQEKYVVDEMAYEKLWQDTKTDVVLWFAGSVLVLFFVSGIYPIEEKKGMGSFLRTTRYGREKLRRSKNHCALICTVAVFLVMEAPLFLQYAQIDQFTTGMQRLSDFTRLSFTSGTPLGLMLAGVFLLKGLSFLGVGFAGVKLSQITKNELVTLLAGVGITGMIAVILYRFGWDINTLFLRIL